MSKTFRRQNPIAVAERVRHAHTQTTMRDKRERRPKDARRHWKREDWG